MQEAIQAKDREHESEQISSDGGLVDLLRLSDLDYQTYVYKATYVACTL